MLSWNDAVHLFSGTDMGYSSHKHDLARVGVSVLQRLSLLLVLVLVLVLLVLLVLLHFSVLDFWVGGA